MNHSSTSPASGTGGARNRPNILMLGGFGRSGSTLLERCLAESRGVVGLGEVLHLWERGLRDDELCGCSLPFSQCPFWLDVGERAYGGWDHVDVEQAVGDRTTVVRNRYLLELITGLTPANRRVRRDRLLGRVNALYDAVVETSAARLIVDSSKHPAYAYLLRRAAINLKCVLVVRDPRGVAYSWSKVVTRPETGSAGEIMPRYSTVSAVANWTLYGVLFHALNLFNVDVKTVHYEDFMASPRQVVDDILRFAGLEPGAGDTEHIQKSEVHLSAHHTVAGNPMRMRTGTLQIKADSAWMVSMPPRDRRVAGILSFPLRLAYGLRRN
ncbi:sulfotransferase [Arthrobacter glacialis]|uniref:sulfotransferase n=1 Tax=Arthrobacter glacialis TaxID=1664 RepID=UPI000CD404AA|nr:sulfotransferase [Arthrobacter glacialis]POH60681.1 sulfotransferase family protein [Arthrobacter glacialis]